MGMAAGNLVTEYTADHGLEGKYDIEKQDEGNMDLELQQ